MTALLSKQLRLNCHPMTLVFLLAGVFLLIPSYPYTVSFFYVTLGIFFMFQNAREQRDADFCAILPIRKRDGVKAACLFTVLVEVTAAVLAIPFAVLSAHINPIGTNQAGMDANASLFALALILMGLFNRIFLPGFFKTGYKVGGPFLKASVVMTLVVICDIVLPHLPGLEWLDRTDAVSCARQLPLLAAGAILFAALSLWAYRRSAALYEKVDL